MRWTILAAAMLGAAPLPAQTPAAPPPAIKLWRLECGSLDENRERPWAWQRLATPCPCFLIRHGDRYMLWDAGISARAIGMNHAVYKLDRTISDQLKVIGVKPEQVEFVGISHYHGDHTGQASQFPQATLLIGAGDLEVLKRPVSPRGAAPPHIKPWLEGGSKVEALVEDHDVFGDGSVKILMTPGHTPGHSALLVKLKSGPMILAGDLWFAHSDVLRGTMPEFNASRAETVASRDRISRLAEALDAVVIIQHEPADLAKLPLFPNPAE